MEHKAAPKRKVLCRGDTFGNSSAAATLALLLNRLDNPKLTAKVSRAFHLTAKRYKVCSKLENSVYYLRLVKADIENTIQNTTWPADIKSYLKNSLDARFKNLLLVK